MKPDSSLIQALVAIAAIIAGFYGVVTVPLLKRMDDIRSDVKDLRTDLAQFKTEIRSDLTAIRTELTNHGERLARVEERLPPPLVHR